ncbi:MAG: hypothetical protein H6Q28_354 [Bacteroidetes bacterium]|nr:hypothetical protein [Bacteroidota bacterium]
MERLFGGAVSLAGLFSVLALSSAALTGLQATDSTAVRADTVAAGSTSVRLLALGDVNLAREVGRRILGGDTLWPFVNVDRELREYDIVFVNLESNLSDQDGETQHPDNNLIFSGPPAGAWALRNAGVSVVSTANNHALDYGRAAKDSTIRYLRQAGVLWSGTANVRDSLYEPAILERNGIRFAFFAVTAIMNMPGDWWKGHVAFADTGKLLPRIRAWRENVDVVVVSYHGGNEYQDRPHRPLREFAEAVLNNGGDLFLGHHPHVPYGIVSVGKGIAAHSLGNFVFHQPQRYWTRRSFGLAVTFTRAGGRTSISDWRVLPLRAGNQPAFLPPGAEADTVAARVRALSSIWKSEMVSWQ